MAGSGVRWLATHGCRSDPQQPPHQQRGEILPGARHGINVDVALDAPVDQLVVGRKDVLVLKDANGRKLLNRRTVGPTPPPAPSVRAMFRMKPYCPGHCTHAGMVELLNERITPLQLA